MVSRELELRLDGEIRLADLASAVLAFDDLVLALTREIAPGLDVTWPVTDLDFGSAVIAAEPVALPSSQIDEIRSAYITVGRQIADADETTYGEEISEPARRLKGLVNGHVSGVEFRCGSERATIGKISPAKTKEPIVTSLGAVRGTVEVLSRRSGLRFSIWDAVFDSRVSCESAEEWEETMRHAWGSEAVVEGDVARYLKSGRPMNVTKITAITIVEPPELGQFESTMGTLSPPADGSLPEERVRKLRDAG